MAGTEILSIAGTAIALATAIVGLSTYRKNAKTKSAEFILSLHKSFFVDNTYQRFKQMIDDEGSGTELAEAVSSEAMEFTDFLNLFELVCYMTHTGAISVEDREALLGYYLNRLRSNSLVWSYLRQDSKSFEHLRQTLVERETL